MSKVDEIILDVANLPDNRGENSGEHGVMLVSAFELREILHKSLAQQGQATAQRSQKLAHATQHARVAENLIVQGAKDRPDLMCGFWDDACTHIGITLKDLESLELAQQGQGEAATCNLDPTPISGWGVQSIGMSTKPTPQPLPSHHDEIQEAVKAGRITFAPGWNDPQPLPDREPLTEGQEREAFEAWHDEWLLEKPVHTERVRDLWDAWEARAAHGIKKGNTP